MNLVDIKVVEILGEPIENKRWWTIKVNQDCCGSISEDTLYFNSKEEALNLKVGYIYLG